MIDPNWSIPGPLKWSAEIQPLGHRTGPGNLVFFFKLKYEANHLDFLFIQVQYNKSPMLQNIY